MRNTLLSFSAVAGLVIGLTATAQAVPASGVALHVNPSLVQHVGWDGDRGWDNDRRWWHRHRDWDRGHGRRRWWWRHHRDDGGWRGDRDHDHDRGDYRERRRGDWR